MSDYFVHESAIIDLPCEIGQGTKIWHFSHIMKNCRIGEKCTIGQNVFIGSGVILGNQVKVQNNVSIYTGVVCEDGVFLGPSMVFTNVIYPRAFIEKKNEFKTTRIKTGAAIGANATIVCGHTIGEYALIGAGSVVSRDIPDYALVYGSPAQIQGWVCLCGERLPIASGSAQCRICGQKFRQIHPDKIQREE